VTNAVVVANNSRTALSGVQAKAWVYNSDGSQQYYNAASLSVPKDTSAVAFTLAFPASGLSSVHFVRLRLYASDGMTLLSDNFYWRGTTWWKYSGLNALPPATLTLSTNGANATVTNSGTSIAFFIRLKVVDQDSNRILPVYYSDNYFSLLPGEAKTVSLTYTGTGTLVAQPYNGGTTTTMTIPRGSPVFRAAPPAVRIGREFIELVKLNPGTDYRMRLFNGQGRLVAEASSCSGGTMRMSTRGAGRGLYLLEVDSKGQTVLNRRVPLY
jgi:hypothetical protein